MAKGGSADKEALRMGTVCGEGLFHSWFDFFLVWPQIVARALHSIGAKGTNFPMISARGGDKGDLKRSWLARRFMAAFLQFH